MPDNRYRERIENLRACALRGGDAVANIPAGPPVPLTEAEMMQFEELIGVRLPEGYRQFLLDVGGAGFTGTCVWPLQVREDYGDREVFEVLYGGMLDRPYSLRTRYEQLKKRFPDTMIPIGENLFGDQFCLSIKGPDRGKIYVYFWEYNFTKVHLVAASFDDFLNRLFREE